MSDWHSKLDEEDRELLEKADHPRWLNPMLATLTHETFSDPDWTFEPKLDGERVLAFRHGERVRLMSRNQKSLNDTYPELSQALASLDVDDFVLDGEIVAFKDGLSSFSRLQERMQIKDRDEALASNVSIYLYVFDLPYLEGYRLDSLPLRRRKALLADLFEYEDPIRYTSHRNEDGEKFHSEACRKGWEGIIAKRADSPYRHSRSRDWLKFKCGERQEFVIGGFTEPKGERSGFGALMLGYYEKDELCYAGKVGTGFDDDFLERFRKRLDELEQSECPFADGVEDNDAHWVEPKLVGEIEFTEWTSDGKLRHPRFLGLRDDKDAEDVVRERPDD